jgi:4'-phosphopantetheinyl transferase
VNTLSLDNATPVDWRSPPVQPMEGEVHVWTWTTDVGFHDAGSLAWLDARERKRYERLVTMPLKQRYLAAHGSLRRLLGSYLDCPPGAVQYGASPAGKPHVATAPLRFNLSHSGDQMVVAVSRAEVGIDIEQLRPVSNLRSLAARHFTAHELAALDDCHEQNVPIGFLSLWTRKEAVLKCLGVGLRCPPRELEVGIGGSTVELIAPPTAWQTSVRTCWLLGGWPRGDMAIALASGAPIGRCSVFGPAAH